jgi:hypothetical protein
VITFVIFASGLKYAGLGTTALGWTLCGALLACGTYWLLRRKPWRSDGQAETGNADAAATAGASATAVAAEPVAVEPLVAEPVAAEPEPGLEQEPAEAPRLLRRTG